MKEANDILTLLGIPSDKIQFFECETNEGNSCIRLELHDIRKPCPKCNSTNIKIKGYYNVSINNSIIKHQKMMVEIKVRRYRCQRCGATFKQDYSFYERSNSISNTLKLAVIDDLKDKLTFSQIAKDHNISINKVRDLFDRFVLPQIPLPLSEIICIDEFCFKHSKSGLGKYPAVITNPMTGDILDIIESRWKDVLIDYFNKVKKPILYQVKYFVSDMNETYRIIKKIFFKDAIHIADRFHVIKAFNDAITTIRTRIIKQEVYQQEEYRYLKKNWKIFLKDRHDLSKIRKVDRYGIVTDPTVNLDRCLAKYPELYYAYWTKEEFRKETSHLLYYGKAMNVIDFFINKLLNSTIQEMVKVGKTLQNWRSEIINGITQNPYSIKISNAIAESTNNTIQTLIDLSYGLPDFKRMRKRVLYINRSKKTRDF